MITAGQSGIEEPNFMSAITSPEEAVELRSFSLGKSSAQVAEHWPCCERTRSQVVAVCGIYVGIQPDLYARSHPLSAIMRP